MTKFLFLTYTFICSLVYFYEFQKRKVHVTIRDIYIQQKSVLAHFILRKTKMLPVVYSVLRWNKLKCEGKMVEHGVQNKDIFLTRWVVQP